MEENISVTQQRAIRDQAIIDEYTDAKGDGTPQSVLVTRIAAKHGVAHQTAYNVIKNAGKL